MITINMSFSPPPKFSFPLLTDEPNKGIAMSGITKNIIRIALFMTF